MRRPAPAPAPAFALALTPAFALAPALALALCGALALSACEDPSPTSAPEGAGGRAGEEAGAGAGSGAGAGAGAPPPRGDCDPLAPEVCALPWPSDFYLRRLDDPEARPPFGRPYLDFGGALPKSARGLTHRAAPYERLDGFGLLAAAIVPLPHLDASGLPDEARIEDSLRPESPVALVELTPAGARRVPCWAELDARSTDPAARLLFVRPAQSLKEGARYAYVLRGLRDEAGALIPRSPAFEAVVRGAPREELAALGVLPARAADLGALLDALEAMEGPVPREELTLAWTFSTASQQALSGPLVHMRDEALAALPLEGPRVTIDEVVELPSDPHIALELRGSFEVPSYLYGEGVEGSAARLDARGLPTLSGGVSRAKLWARVPRVALPPAQGGEGRAVGVVVYLHGLLYSGAEVRAGDKGPAAAEGGYIFVGTDFVGMSEEELPFLPLVFLDMSNFRVLVERQLQGVLNTLALARLAKRGLGALPALVERGVRVDPARVVLGGISQGGIFGATALALSQDVTRGHLGVPGQDYFTLLGRSKNFTGLFTLLAAGYPRVVDQWVTLAAAQTLWNLTDPSSYYPHIAVNPLPNTPLHAALLAPAQGDPQVAPVTAETAARGGLGFAVMEPYSRDRVPPLAARAAYPRAGSAVVSWDFGVPWAPLGAAPPAPERGDPHELPRAYAPHRAQMLHFWETGEVIDTCGGAPCGPGGAP